MPGPPLIEEREDDLFGAAYEDVTYQDTTDDDEGAVSDGGPVEEFDLEQEGERLEKRLHFLSTLARLWQIAARTVTEDRTGRTRLGADAERLAADGARQSAAAAGPARRHPRASAPRADRRLRFAGGVRPPPRAQGATAVHDHRRLPGHVAGRQRPAGRDRRRGGGIGRARGATAWEPFAIRLEQALFAGEASAAREVLPAFLEQFQTEPLLFTPLTEGGTPRQILRVRIAQTVLRALLANLPRLGLLRETYDLLRTARAMEQAQPMRGRGVTEFNHFFQAAYQAVVESVVDVGPDLGQPRTTATRNWSPSWNA